MYTWLESYKTHTSKKYIANHYKRFKYLNHIIYNNFKNYTNMGSDTATKLNKL